MEAPSMEASAWEEINRKHTGDKAGNGEAEEEEKEESDQEARSR